MDPTGTAGLRRQFRAAALRQLTVLRRATYSQLVEHDYLNHKHDPLTAIYGKQVHNETQTFDAFVVWFKNAAQLALVSTPWWGKFVERSFTSGIASGADLVRSDNPPRTSTPASYLATARVDMEGIAASLTSAVTRTLASYARSKSKPLVMYRAILQEIKKVGMQRLNAFCNSLIVQAHNAGRLAAYRAAGVAEVGVIPETLPEPPSVRVGDRFHQHVHDEDVDVLTAGDDRVCPICEGLALDGPYDIDDPPDIPAHPNCRCALVPAGVYSEEELLGEEEL